jgi:hypothetical protein
MNDLNIPLVPRGIGPRGKAFWVDVQGNFQFDARETELLLELCRVLTTIDLLAEAVAADGVMLEGSQGQKVLNGAVAELRQQQAAYARLVTQLNLEGAATGEAMRSPRAASAAATAKRRWQKDAI